MLLITAISLRSLAAVGLLQYDGTTVWHWAALGPTYLLFGVTAPFVTLLLLLKRGEWVLTTALLWLLVGWLGVLLAAMLSVLLSSSHLPLLVYPLLPEPLHLSLFLSLGLVDLLVQTAAIYYLGGQTAQYYHKVPSKTG